MASEQSNHYKFQKQKGLIILDSDSLIIILMNNTFTFNKDTHATYANVSGDELATNYGYTVKTKVLANGTTTEDDANDRSETVFDNAAWTAAGGTIGPSNGACIIDDTTTDDTVVGYIDFGGAQSATDGGTFTVSDIKIRDA